MLRTWLGPQILSLTTCNILPDDLASYMWRCLRHVPNQRDGRFTRTANEDH
jgi:hypothetical protein